MAFNLFGFPTTAYIISTIITLSVIAVFAAIVVDFIIYNQKGAVKNAKRSVVATGSMIGFYIVYYFILWLRLGNLDFTNIYSVIVLVIIGTTMIVIGAIVNIFGRIQLKGNWANQIKIYSDHCLVNRGVYRIVRHPLYASIMLMLFGGSIAYRNWLSAALTAFIFIPFMYFRARQEEELLLEEFLEYKDYKNRTGMFFPKLWR